MDNDITIRQATLEDLDLVTAIEAECFPAAEAATREQFAARLAAYAFSFTRVSPSGLLTAWSPTVT